MRIDHRGTTLRALLAYMALATLPASARAGTGAATPVAQAHGDVPSVMLVLDTSAVMDEALCHPGYDAATVWSGLFSSAASYPVGFDGMRSPHSFHPTWPNQPSAFLVASAAGHPGLYSGNYLNWVYFHAGASQRETLPRFTRITAMKSVVSTAVAMNPDIRFGLTIFNGDDGGRVVAPMGESRAWLAVAIAGMKADSYAPWAETAEDMLRLFSRSDNAAPVVDPRHPVFLLMIVGGLPTMDLDVSPYLRDADGDGDGPGTCSSLGASHPDSLDCSAYLDDVTWYMATNDLRPDLPGPQVVNSYGLGLQFNHWLFKSAADNGAGTWSAIWNPGDLLPGVNRVLADMRRHLAEATPMPRPLGAPVLLGPSRPNPFNPMTAMAFELPEPGVARLSIHDLRGRRLRVLVSEALPRGRHEVIWDGRDAAGRGLGSGAYLVVLEYGGSVETQRVMLVR